MDIVLLADRPDLIPALAAAYEAEWPDWYGPRGPGDALADLTARARREGLPLGLVLLDGDAAVGALAITPDGPVGYEHLSPWIGGGWVEPALRRRTLGARLLEAAVAQARLMGLGRLHVGTATAVPLMERAGWTRLEQDGELALFVLDLS